MECLTKKNYIAKKIDQLSFSKGEILMVCLMKKLEKNSY